MDTGGWELTDQYAAEGTRCLAAGGTVYDGEPLTPAQMRALAALLAEEANKVEWEGA